MNQLHVLQVGMGTEAGREALKKMELILTKTMNDSSNEMLFLKWDTDLEQEIELQLICNWGS